MGTPGSPFIHTSVEYRDPSTGIAVWYSGLPIKPDKNKLGGFPSPEEDNPRNMILVGYVAPSPASQIMAGAIEQSVADYCDGADYFFYPEIGPSTSYNSNGFAHTLVSRSGGYFVPRPEVAAAFALTAPGWSRTLPNHPYFDQ